MRRFSTFSRNWMLLTLVVFSGCGKSGPELVPVRGIVTLDGSPIPAGKFKISFESTELGFAASTQIEADGSYTIRCQHGEGLPAGHYIVTVASPSGDSKDPKRPRLPPPIPLHYQFANTSGLEAEVQKGAGPFNFNLKK